MIVFVAVLFTGVLDCLLPINSFLLITSLVTLIVCGLAGPHCIVSTLPWPHPSHSHLWALYSISNALKSWPYQPTMKHDQKTSAYFTVYSMNSNLFCVKGWSSKHAEGYQGVWSILRVRFESFGHPIFPSYASVSLALNLITLHM